jgi:hypothetical protein
MSIKPGISGAAVPGDSMGLTAGTIDQVAAAVAGKATGSAVGSIGGGIAKIDGIATLGLLGVADSLAYRVGEIERHLHSYEKWFARAAVPSGETHVADRIGTGTAAFQVDGGNNTWGAWVQIVGSSDTPVQAAAAYFDLHRMMITDIENDGAVHFVQIAFGESGAAALTAGNYTEFVFKSQAVNTEETPVSIQTRRAAARTKCWARVWSVGQNTGTMDFYIGFHEYEG